ncbi:MAG: Type 1 glutamine amidotransferase-like domain-containing protein [Candidatus Pacearchaeota archaeon]|nr:Type 1 glutamine amidotransferase-like domain-containing protein [Candidatus Pacearchaeota archaeon]
MKLLLTSAGITNKSIENILKKLLPENPKIAFIPTGANVEEGDKDWVIKDLNDCQKFGEVDIVDVSAIPKTEWLPRLKWANVFFVEGGDTDWLMKCIDKSGLSEELPKLLKTRIYIGASAGSIVLSKTLFASSEFIDFEKKDSPKGLGCIEFNFRPHFNSESFPKADEKFLDKISEKFVEDLYAIDDNSAILINGDNIEIISEGKWKKYSKSKN